MTDILAVLFVLALLAAATLLLRKHGLSGLTVNGARHLQSVERLRLGPSHTVHLIRVGGRRLLIATHGGGCTLLSETGQGEDVPK